MERTYRSERQFNGAAGGRADGAEDTAVHWRSVVETILPAVGGSVGGDDKEAVGSGDRRDLRVEEVVAGGSGGEIWRRRDLAAARSTAPSVKLRRDSSFAAAAAAARVRNASPSSRLGNPSTRRVCASFLGLTRLYTGLPNGL
jgi:hypothetical protein